MKHGDGEIEEIKDEIERRYKLFKHFQVDAFPPKDHHFAKSKRRRHTYGRDKTIIQKEWEALAADLPNTIFVRGYERRQEYMRAVMIGPDHTPYRHGLFCFDIYLPSTYPSMPPQLYYHSHGFELNPTLNKKGEVDLKEEWNEHDSNILKLLVSIQEENLCGINKDVFVKITCETMIRTMRSPFGGFEDFVNGYFRFSAHDVLMNFRGHVDRNDDTKKTFVGLYEAFKKNGTYCKHHLTPLLKAEMLAEEKQKH